MALTLHGCLLAPGSLPGEWVAWDYLCSQALQGPQVRSRSPATGPALAPQEAQLRVELRWGGTGRGGGITGHYREQGPLSGI